MPEKTVITKVVVDPTNMPTSTPQPLKASMIFRAIVIFKKKKNLQCNYYSQFN